MYRNIELLCCAPGTARVKGEVLPQSLLRLCSPVVTLIFGPMKLIMDFWTPDL